MLELSLKSLKPETAVLYFPLSGPDPSSKLKNLNSCTCLGYVNVICLILSFSVLQKK
jgi:hypothetical protein